MIDERIDVRENIIADLSQELLGILLVDRTTGKNIIWATDNYSGLGKGYRCGDEITIQKITEKNGNIIKPRVKKNKNEQLHRMKDKAEVFTPSWVCNKMNNYIDEVLLYKNAFNLEKEKDWVNINENVKFKNKNDWKKYVNYSILEMACGEAPFLSSRYDTVSGDILDIKSRIGIIDRKMRIVNENVKKGNDEIWIEWTKNAFKHIYGFEWQGDSLLISRENLLYTFIDYYIDRFNCRPKLDILKDMAYIISWNLWQMDGLKGVIPYSCNNVKAKKELTLFDYLGDEGKRFVKSSEKMKKCKGCECSDIKNSMVNKYHNGEYCKIRDWDNDKTILFIDCIKE